MPRRAYYVVLAVIVLLGAYLRLVDLGGPSLWHDEILHLDAAERLAQQPWYQLLAGVEEVADWTENGPVYYWLQTLGSKTVAGAAGARLLPAICGILALPLMALCGNLLGGRLVSLVATFVLAVSPLHVYFSREGRPYSLIMLLALLFLYSLLKRDSRLGILTAYGGCIVGAYVGVHTIPILAAFLGLALLAVAWGVWRDGESVLRSPFRHHILAAVLTLALSYSLYMVKSETNVVGSPGIASPVHLSPLSGRAMDRFMASMTTSGHQSVLLGRRSWILIGLSVVGLLAGLRRRPREMVATAGMFLLPAFLSIAALVVVGRWYGLRYTSPALPAFLLLVAVGIVATSELVVRLVGRKMSPEGRNVVTAAGCAVLVLLVVAPNVDAAQADPYRKLDWRGVAGFVKDIAIDGEPIVVPNLWPKICLGYYLRDSQRDLPFKVLKESVERGEWVVGRTPRGWLLTAGFRETGDVRTWMHQFHPVLKYREEEMALFFFPDFVTLMETRFEAGKGAVFERQFEAMGRRFDFDGAEMMLQGQGWSYHEENKEGIEYQWAMGDQAELGLPLGERREARIRFRALPFMYPDALPQSVEVWLNESRLGTIDLPRGWSDHEISVPEATWSSGANMLYLRFARSTIPAEVAKGSQDRRSLSAAFDYLELVDEDR
jgi:mannosyltransferase